MVVVVVVVGAHINIPKQYAYTYVHREGILPVLFFIEKVAVPFERLIKLLDFQ